MVLSTEKSHTFLDEITLGDDELDGWVDSALGGSEDFVKELLELGEDSLEFSAAEDELRKLQGRLNDAESRESRLKQEVQAKCEKIAQLENTVGQLKQELLEERVRAKDEAEDMAQEMAELRYQMTEMLEEERQLRAHTEKLSVHRVGELELQVKQAREELIAALRRRREAEMQSEKEILELRVGLQEMGTLRQERDELRRELSQLKGHLQSKEVYSDKEEVEQVKEIASTIKEPRHASGEQVQALSNDQDPMVVREMERESAEADAGASEFVDAGERLLDEPEEVPVPEEEPFEAHHPLEQLGDERSGGLADVKTYEVEQQSEIAASASAFALNDAREKLSALEEELQLCKNKNEGLQKAVEAREEERSILQEELHRVKGLLQTQEQSTYRQRQEMLGQRSQLTRKIGELNSEVLILQQQLITCQTQVSEMAMKNVILEDTILVKERKIKEGEEAISELTTKLATQEEKHFNLQSKFNALQNDFLLLESKLAETRRKEQEARVQIERLSLELGMAKQEVVKSEIRLQKSIKLADAGKSKIEGLLNKQHQMDRYLSRLVDQLKQTEAERDALQLIVARE